MSPRQSLGGHMDEETPMEALQRQVKAQEVVLRDYKETIDDLDAKLAKAKTIQEDKIAAAAEALAKPLIDQLDMYQTLVKGWPKGKKLIKKLNRPYDY